MALTPQVFGEYTWGVTLMRVKIGVFKGSSSSFFGGLGAGADLRVTMGCNVTRKKTFWYSLYLLHII